MNTRRQIRIPAHGLISGGAGATTIERVRPAADGVPSPDVNRATETALVDHDSAETAEGTLARAIERAGDQVGRRVEA
jgi:hypothetical protein